MTEEKERLRILLAPAEQSLLQHVHQLLQKDIRFEVVEGTTDGEQAW